MSGTIILWLMAGAVLLSAWALFNVYRSRQWMEAIQADLGRLQLSQPADDSAGALAPAAQPPGLECVIRLHDPLQVARQESRLATAFTGVAPNLLSREVYRQVREETLVLLEKRNIGADVQVRVC